MGRLPVLLAWLVAAASWRAVPTAAAVVAASSNGDRDPEGQLSQPLVRDQPPAFEESALDGIAIDAAAAAAEEEYNPIGLQIWPDGEFVLDDPNSCTVLLVDTPSLHS